MLSLGCLPSANVMTPDAPTYPADVLKCRSCLLVQLGTIVDPSLIFPPDYPYSSGTTKSLRENFADLARKTEAMTDGRTILDIGSNDGSLLEAFEGWRTHGVEPTDQALKARAKGIRTTQEFFSEEVARDLGQFDVVTATNVFAHIADIHSVLRGVVHLLGPDGIFITESTYWLDTLAKTQYDTIYHEHLRYYTLTSLANLLRPYGLVPFHVERIPTMGGSIRVFAGYREPDETVSTMLEDESRVSEDGFAERVENSRTALLAMLPPYAYGIGAASRSTTLITYTGIDLTCVCEIKGSDKIGKVVPGTTIPVVDEQRLVDDQPEFALVLSWHIADEVMGNLRRKGYQGRFIVPLPEPRFV